MPIFDQNEQCIGSTPPGACCPQCGEYRVDYEYTLLHTSSRSYNQSGNGSTAYEEIYRSNAAQYSINRYHIATETNDRQCEIGTIKHIKVECMNILQVECDLYGHIWLDRTAVIIVLPVITNTTTLFTVSDSVPSHNHHTLFLFAAASLQRAGTENRNTRQQS